MSPFSNIPAETIAALGEKALLVELRGWLGDCAPPTPQGMGDDTAVLDPPTCGKLLITTDSLVLNVHFDASMDPASVGGKLLRRNLSDIAAMGGQPSHAVVAGFLPANTRTAWLQAVMLGLAAAARQHAVQIVGGDLSACPADLALNLTLLGHAERPLTRHGGRHGDRIAVTGPLGGSFPLRHLLKEPSLQQGQLLASLPGVVAAMDISDGLSIDLPALLPPGSSAYLFPDRIPIHPDAITAAARSGHSPIWHALNDGEDYELLFLFRNYPGPASNDCSAPVSWQQLLAAFAQHQLPTPTDIGYIGTANPAALLINAASMMPLDATQGYNHFQFKSGR